MIELNKGYNCDNIELLKLIPDGSLDIICIDPPYLYLKGQKLERAFDEPMFFSECKRVLKKDGFIVMFGRGTSFYRWNTILDELGFTFKEEIVWDKRYTTSSMHPIGRCHETVTVMCKGEGKINKVRIPYTEAKYDIEGIKGDISRIRSACNRPHEFEAIIKYLDTNTIDFSEDKKRGYNTTIQGVSKEQVRPVKMLQAMNEGMIEKSIVRISREHYSFIHPTQKPVRLLERLIALVKPKHENIIAADFFAGSFSFAEACINMGINWICCEIDKEYYDAGINRIEQLKIKS